MSCENVNCEENSLHNINSDDILDKIDDLQENYIGWSAEVSECEGNYENADCSLESEISCLYN